MPQYLHHQPFVSIAAIRTTKALRYDFIKHVLRQNVAYFDSDEAASVTTQATSNGNNVNNGISEKLTLTIQGVSTFVSAFVVAFAVQWKLTLITISIVPTIIVVTAVSIGIDTKNENKLLPIYSRAGQLAEEVFSTIRTVHAFWLHPLLSSKYDKILGDAMDLGMKKSPNYAVLFSIEFFCIYSGYGLAFWQGIRMFARGEIKQSGMFFAHKRALAILRNKYLHVHRQRFHRHYGCDCRGYRNDGNCSPSHSFNKSIRIRRGAF